MKTAEEIAYQTCPNCEYRICASCADCGEQDDCPIVRTARLAYAEGRKQTFGVCHAYVSGFARAVNIAAILWWLEEKITHD